MKVSVIGSGGREHALVWKLHQSQIVSSLICIPGNPGTEQYAENIQVELSNHDLVVKVLKERKTDLVVIGPEQPLVEGLADRVRDAGIRCFGPSKDAAELEGSKAFAKEFMKRYNIPTAEYKIFTENQLYDAIRYLDEIPKPVVIKASGLAAGKGVVICDQKEEAEQVIQGMLTGKVFKDAGRTIVVEEYLEGEEISMFAIADGKSYVILPPAQDHKKLLDGDKGKNTGGMGAYAPTPLVSEELVELINRKVFSPTLRGLQKENRPYIGCLYAGIILTKSGQKVLEYNCRFGDPEAQVVLPLIDEDLGQLLYDVAGGNLKKRSIKVHDATAVCVVMASRGYPDTYKTGKEVRGLESIKEEDGIVVFHAGTKKEKEKTVTAGGRVLGVTAIGYKHDLEGTIRNAYSAVSKITFDGAYYRGDIGAKARATNSSYGDKL